MAGDQARHHGADGRGQLETVTAKPVGHKKTPGAVGADNGMHIGEIAGVQTAVIAQRAVDAERGQAVLQQVQLFEAERLIRNAQVVIRVGHGFTLVFFAHAADEKLLAPILGSEINTVVLIDADGNRALQRRRAIQMQHLYAHR